MRSNLVWVVELELEREHAHDQQLGLDDAVAQRPVHLADLERVELRMQRAIAHVHDVAQLDLVLFDLARQVDRGRRD